MNFYRILRDNKELGPFSLDEIKNMGLRSSDLIWIDGQSAAWRFPDEVPGFLSQFENAGTKAEAQAPQHPDFFNVKPKKRYRLTADHRMVEITEEEAKSSDLPRIEEQPPAPRTEMAAPPTPGKKATDGGVVPFHDIGDPFIKKTAALSGAASDSLPLEPELEKRKADILPKKEQGAFVPFQGEPFGKKANNGQPEDASLPLEPVFTPADRNNTLEDFVDIDPNKKNDMGNDNHTPSNTGAFVLAGLLFLVAIGFFGYKWYQDQHGPQNAETMSLTDSTHADSSRNNYPNEFSKSRSIALNDDTLGQHERLMARKALDSIQLKAANATLAARKAAKADSIQNALAAQHPTDDPSVSPDAATHDEPKSANNDSAKEKNKVNKIKTTEDIGKYVRVGVVQPKAQTNGVSGVKLVVHNINNRNLAKVHINVLYFDSNGNVIKKSTIIAPNITVGNSVTVPVADYSGAAYVSYKVTGLLGDHVSLQAK